MFYYTVGEDITLKLLTQQNATELFNIVEKNRGFLREWLPWINSKKLLKTFKVLLKNRGDKYIANIAINAGIFFKGELVGMVAFPKIDWIGL